MYNFVCPIYWTKTFKTKNNETHLIGMNYYRNAVYYDQNRLKREIEDQLKQSCTSMFIPITTPFKVHYTLYYKNPSCDGANIIALVEKIFLDFIQDIGLVPNDTVKYHYGSTWNIGEQDMLNPRCEIILELHDASIQT